MNMKLKTMIHPFLFAIFPILFLFAYNVEEVIAIDLVVPILVAVVGTLILLPLLRLLTRSWSKGAIATSLFLVLFFSYGHIRDMLFSAGMPALFHVGTQYIGAQFALGFLWVLLFATGTFLIIRTHKDFSILTKFLNITIIILVIASLCTISMSKIGKTEVTIEKTKVVNMSGGNPNKLPDIYYIILDTYARQDALLEVFNYDNSEFVDYLTDKGFYVATKSKSNYDYTTFSLASSLNMRYLTEQEQEDPTARQGTLNYNEVAQLLKDKGYYYIFVTGGGDSMAGATSGLTDVSLKYKADSVFRESVLSNAIMQTTALSTFAWHFKDFFDNSLRQSRLFGFSEAANIPYIEEPTFTYVYVVLPHAPYVFNRDGDNVIPDISDIGNVWSPVQNDGRYIDQLVFTSQKTKTLIEEIISRSNIAPIIILQGDHSVWWKGAERRFEILNAYYLPGVEHDLYETISPVNSFRVVFNLYFGADYKLLEDKYYETGLWEGWK